MCLVLIPCGGGFKVALETRTKQVGRKEESRERERDTHTQKYLLVRQPESQKRAAALIVCNEAAAYTNQRLKLA